MKSVAGKSWEAGAETSNKKNRGSKGNVNVPGCYYIANEKAKAVSGQRKDSRWTKREQKFEDCSSQK